MAVNERLRRFTQEQICELVTKRIGIGPKYISDFGILYESIKKDTGISINEFIEILDRLVDERRLKVRFCREYHREGPTGNIVIIFTVTDAW